MAYQTGQVADATALKTAITTFAALNGWTLTGDVLDRDGVFAELVVLNANQLRLRGAIDAGFVNAWSSNGRIVLNSWPATYHLFALTSPLMLMCVLNHDAVRFQHLGFGRVETRLGGWDGGQWYSASVNAIAWSNVPDKVPLSVSSTFTSQGSNNPQQGPSVSCAVPFIAGRFTGSASCSLYADVSNHGVGWSDSITTASTTGAPGGSFAHFVQMSQAMKPMIFRQPNAWNSQATLLRWRLFSLRNESKVSFLGELGHLRALRIDNLAPLDLITLGPDSWMVFPMVLKDAVNRNGGTTSVNDLFSDINAHSGTWGWAIRRDDL